MATSRPELEPSLETVSFRALLPPRKRSKFRLLFVCEAKGSTAEYGGGASSSGSITGKAASSYRRIDPYELGGNLEDNQQLLMMMHERWDAERIFRGGWTHLLTLTKAAGFSAGARDADR